jgi:cytochrome c oxidase subunit 3/cytochrome o ubiquinol oxidase subunit 3
VNETGITPTLPAGQGVQREPTAPVTRLPVPPDVAPEKTLSAAQWGMVCFLISEAALFSTLIVTYLHFVGKDRVGPTPAEVLSVELVLANTLCLLASSITIHQAEHLLRRGRQWSFCLWWVFTIVLGLVFLAGTGYEWYNLIVKHQLTISRNLFGSTFYTLVGFHAFHVTGGVVAMLIVLALALRRQVTADNPQGVGLVAWYWHFVDGVWVVVFAVVYLIGR